MRQATLGSELESLMTVTANVRVRVEGMETGDYNAPAWEQVAGRYDLMVTALTANQRVTEAPAYNAIVTHYGYGADDEAVKIGGRLVETHRLDEHRQWNQVTGGRTWEVLGKEELSGWPEPYGQVKLALTLTSAVT